MSDTRRDTPKSVSKPSVDLTEEEKKKFVEWIKYELDADKAVSGDEFGVRFNLIHQVWEGKDYQPYGYLPHQDEEIESWETPSPPREPDQPEKG